MEEKEQRWQSIQVRGLNFSYGGEGQPWFITNFNLDLPKGSRQILVGANGSGKTTLLKILAGKHMVGGKDVVQVLGRSAFHDTSLVCSGELAYLGGSWSKAVGCAGDIPLQGDFSAKDMIFGVEGVDPARRDKLIELLDIDLHWRMHKVSDGQRRRVQICMGILHPFKVLLLDEVTVDLDVVARLDLLDFLREECEQRGASIVYATHIFDGLESWATHIAYIKDGKLKRFESLSKLDEMKNARNMFEVVESWLRAESNDNDSEVTSPAIQSNITRPLDLSPFTSSRHMAYYR
ncbi:hypothetical protein SUGI_0615260 [Cryptomeria japonica]|nr:hypothetical protein SUGI_0615260 [Cryptomeria japonica]